LLENSLHNAGADAELFADLKDAVTAGSIREFALQRPAPPGAGRA
jgi:hypothetical protein